MLPGVIGGLNFYGFKFPKLQRRHAEDYLIYTGSFSSGLSDEVEPLLIQKGECQSVYNYRYLDGNNGN